ncbi:MAG: chromate efflux transporter [Bacteroidota bacterium]|nr:chromate efflux transporter [Bacteroidota bacterium]
MSDSGNKLKDIAILFLKLGTTAFGGPAAHIAMMQQEVVDKRKWYDRQNFLDLVGATNLIPGPNSTELAIHIGYDKGGWKGLLIAGLCFIFPAVFITTFIAYMYKEYGHLPDVQKFIYGIKPAILSIVIGAVLPLLRTAGKTLALRLIGILAFLSVVFGANELAVLFGAGFLAVFINKLINNSSNNSVKSFLPVLGLKISTGATAALTNAKLFFLFLKIGAVIYGSGYVLFAFLDAELVANGLLSRQQLIDAIAVGQFTPGPVFSAVTFVGYQMNGFSGAALATLGVFLPSFLFVAVLHLFMKKLKTSPWFTAFLDGVNIASVALILMVCSEIGIESIKDWRTITIALASLFLVFGFKKLNTAFIVVFASLTGYLLTYF